MAPDALIDLIDEPCAMDWHAMPGEAARRWCGQCRKHVHDVSALSAVELARVAAGRGGVCVRLTMPPDAPTPPGSGLVSAQRMRRGAVHSHVMRTAAALLSLSACTPHRAPASDPVETPAARVHVPAPVPTPPPRHEGMGGVMGALRMEPARPDTTGVPCDTLPARAQAVTGGPRPDLLALCDP